MKKLMLILLFGALVLTPTFGVYAEETIPAESVPQEEQTDVEEPVTEPQKTEFALWWENNIEPYIWQYATALAGAASGIAILIGYIRKIVKALKGSKENYDADIGKAETKLNEAMQDLEAKKAEYLAQIAELKEQIHVDVSECVAAVRDEIAGIKEEAHKAVEMSLVAFTNNRDLVVSGNAKKIAEIAKGAGHDNKG